MSDNKLKECPFCGCEPEYHHLSKSVRIVCRNPNCLAQGGSDYTAGGAVYRWNNRAEMTPQQLAKQAENMGYAVVPLEHAEDIGGVWFDAISLMPEKLAKSEDYYSQALWIYKAMIEAGRVKT